MVAVLVVAALVVVAVVVVLVVVRMVKCEIYIKQILKNLIFASKCYYIQQLLLTTTMQCW